jgi:hypothetical protein
MTTDADSVKFPARFRRTSQYLGAGMTWEIWLGISACVCFVTLPLFVPRWIAKPEEFDFKIFAYVMFFFASALLAIYKLNCSALVATREGISAFGDVDATFPWQAVERFDLIANDGSASMFDRAHAVNLVFTHEYAKVMRGQKPEGVHQSLANEWVFRLPQVRGVTPQVLAMRLGALLAECRRDDGVAK